MNKVNICYDFSGCFLIVVCKRAFISSMRSYVVFLLEHPLAGIVTDVELTVHKLLHWPISRSSCHNEIHWSINRYVILHFIGP